MFGLGRRGGGWEVGEAGGWGAGCGVRAAWMGRGGRDMTRRMKKNARLWSYLFDWARDGLHGRQLASRKKKESRVVDEARAGNQRASGHIHSGRTRNRN